mmetsp:Transcript_17022/g.43164  ORF Transcript_17022/g.43164 Transcript_17022/m.43164 type:complete len:394 (-) Transcript_17022:196-1377(-)
MGQNGREHGRRGLFVRHRRRAVCCEPAAGAQVGRVKPLDDAKVLVGLRRPAERGERHGSVDVVLGDVRLRLDGQRELVAGERKLSRVEGGLAKVIGDQGLASLDFVAVRAVVALARVLVRLLRGSPVVQGPKAVPAVQVEHAARRPVQEGLVEELEALPRGARPAPPKRLHRACVQEQRLLALEALDVSRKDQRPGAVRRPGPNPGEALLRAGNVRRCVVQQALLAVRCRGQLVESQVVRRHAQCRVELLGRRFVVAHHHEAARAGILRVRVFRQGGLEAQHFRVGGHQLLRRRHVAGAARVVAELPRQLPAEDERLGVVGVELDEGVQGIERLDVAAVVDQAQRKMHEIKGLSRVQGCGLFEARQRVNPVAALRVQAALRIEHGRELPAEYH